MGCLFPVYLGAGIAYIICVVIAVAEMFDAVESFGDRAVSNDVEVVVSVCSRLDAFR